MQHDNSHRTSISDIIHFYKGQLERFYKIGVGNKTEYNTPVTDSLIAITYKRMNELQTKRDKLVYKERDRYNGSK